MSDREILYLTHITLSARARSLTRDTQAMHRTIAYATQDHPGRALWALPTPRHLVIQTTAPLDITTLDGLSIAHHTRLRPPTHPTGTHLEVSIIVNATRAHSRPDKRSQRLPLPDHEVAPWTGRALDGALTLHTIQTAALGTRHGRRHTDRLAHTLHIVTATATVTDPDRLADLITGGVGRAKAYGAGLLLTREVTA